MNAQITTRRAIAQLNALLRDAQLRGIISSSSSSSIECSGGFGYLPTEIIRLVVEGVVTIPIVMPFGLQQAEAARQSIYDLISLAQTCRLLNDCITRAFPWIRLEAVARASTALTPIDRKTKTPFFSQCLAEERSKVDIITLQSALKAMVCHCARDHCKGARRHHNSSLTSTANQGQTTIQSVAMQGRVPQLKVLWQHCSLLAVAAHASECAVYACVRPVSTRRGNQLAITRHSLIRVAQTASTTWNPNTDLTTLARKHIGESQTSAEAEVAQLAVSPCGRFIGTVGRDSSQQSLTAHSVRIWDTTQNSGVVISPPLVATGGVAKRLWFYMDANETDLRLAVVWATTTATVICSYVSSIANTSEFVYESTKHRFDNARLTEFGVASSGRGALCIRQTMRGPDFDLTELEASVDFFNMEESMSVTVRKKKTTTIDRPTFVPAVVALSSCLNTTIVFCACHGHSTRVEISVRAPNCAFVCTHSFSLRGRIGEMEPVLSATFRVEAFPWHACVSPCGRFVAATFGDDGCSGIGIIDLSSRTQTKSPNVIWMPTLLGQLPRQMHWNSVGIWMRTGQGALLLGAGAPTPT
jgi:hypothetical protein